VVALRLALILLSSSAADDVKWLSGDMGDDRHFSELLFTAFVQITFQTIFLRS